MLSAGLEAGPPLSRVANCMLFAGLEAGPPLSRVANCMLFAGLFAGAPEFCPAFDKCVYNHRHALFWAMQVLGRW